LAQHPLSSMNTLRLAAGLALLSLAAACGTPNPPAMDGKASSPSHQEPSPKEATAVANTNTMSFYDLKTQSLEGTNVDLGSYRGKVTLVVNVASACGYTPQYAGLQKLHAELKDQGFAVLGFPSNDFGGQEPGTAEQIREFCNSKYSVDFPMFGKVQTKSGAGQSPIYAALGKDGSLPTWNFCKYLIGKDGTVLGFYPSKVAPDNKELRAAIEAALK
jgi:glutathione peroxidase